MVVVIDLSKGELMIFEGFTCEILSGWGWGPWGPLCWLKLFNKFGLLHNPVFPGQAP